jgi:surfactin synthase thioesterase subunit
MRLFCLPYAGAGASVYRTWAADLPSDVELCAVQFPGREGRFRERAASNVSELLPPLVAGLRPLLDRPYAIYGHSLGALVGFELVRALRAAGLPPPVAFFPAAHRAPNRPNPHPELRHLADDRFIDEVGRRFGGVPQAILDHPDLLALMLPTLRADFSVYETYAYRAEAPLGCPIAALVGEHDAYARVAEHEDWALQTTAGFEMHVVPGGHFFLQSHRAAVIAVLAASLSAALGRVGVA